LQIVREVEDGLQNRPTAGAELFGCRVCGEGCAVTVTAGDAGGLGGWGWALGASVKGRGAEVLAPGMARGTQIRRGDAVLQRGGKSLPNLLFASWLAFLPGRPRPN